MIFRVEALHGAVAAYLSADPVRRLPAAVSAAGARRGRAEPKAVKDIIDVHHAVGGDSLASLLFPGGAADIAKIPPVLARPHGRGRGVSLSPEDASEHPALPRRSPKTSGAALVAPVADGATLAGGGGQNPATPKPPHEIFRRASISPLPGTIGHGVRYGVNGRSGRHCQDRPRHPLNECADCIDCVARNAETPQP
jgi:hypothetical protein